MFSKLMEMDKIKSVCDQSGQNFSQIMEILDETPSAHSDELQTDRSGCTCSDRGSSSSSIVESSKSDETRAVGNLMQMMHSSSYIQK